MNVYMMVGSGVGTTEATTLSARLARWHDAMVAHERKIRAGHADAACDEECPHANARTLWIEAREIFGDRVQELTFLRSRAAGSGGRGRRVRRGRAGTEPLRGNPRGSPRRRTDPGP